MAFDWNVFRIMADVSHTLSKCILIWAIHSNKSAEGVSLITQLSYLLVFCSRYLFLPLWSAYDRSEFHKFWNLTLKLFYIASSAYIVFIMMRVYARTREKEKAWKLGIGSLLGSAVAAPFIMLIMKSKAVWGFPELAWIFSILLESTCILPQLLLLRQTSVPTVLDSFYLSTLGSYRFFYVLNWLVRAVRDQDVDIISVIFGLVQTALYLDFAWVYWTRQRVKLRGGSIVDEADLGKGWLVRRFVGRGGANGEQDAEGGNVNYNDQEQYEARTANGGNGPRTSAETAAAAIKQGRRTLGGLVKNGWRNKNNNMNNNSRNQGLSIRADDGVNDIESARAEDALASPDQFEDDIEDDAVNISPTLSRATEQETTKPAPPPKTTAPTNVMDDDDNDMIVDTGTSVEVGNGSEWREDGVSR